MAFGCGLNVMKLNDRGKSSKGSMPLDKACLEACEERASRTENVDKSRSHLNEYFLPDGVSNGDELTIWFRGKLAERSAERIANGGKKISSLACPAATFTINPSEDECKTWDEETRQKFARDAIDAWADWSGHAPDVYMIHRDEGNIGDQGFSMHIFDRMLDENGDYSINKRLNKISLANMHRTWVKGMQSRGWDIDEHLSRDEHRERGDKHIPSGLSANEYVQARQWERDLKQREEFITEQEQNVVQKRVELENKIRRQDLRKDSLDKRESAIAKREAAITEREANATEKIKQHVSDLEQRKAKIEGDISKANEVYAGLYKDCEKLGNEYDDLVGKYNATLKNKQRIESEAETYAATKRQRADDDAKQVRDDAANDAANIRAKAAEDADKIRADAQRQAQQQVEQQTQRLREQQDALDAKQRAWDEQREKRKKELSKMHPPYMDLQFALCTMKAIQDMVAGVKKPKYEQTNELARDLGRMIGQLMAESFSISMNNDLFSKSLNQQLDAQQAKDARERNIRTSHIMREANLSTGHTDYNGPSFG